MSTGHVFVLRGDLRHLECDAWAMSCDKRARPRDRWFPPGYSGPRGAPGFPANCRAQPLPGWPVDRPRAWLVNAGGNAATPIGWFVAGAREFVERVVATGLGPPRNGRALPLVALPVVGTGAGGGLERAGEILRDLLPELRTLARRHSVDLALVAKDAPTYAAAQAERSRGGADWFSEHLSDDLRDQAESLARDARAGNLALFLGAGASIGAGAPGWNDLLKELAREAGLDDAERNAVLTLRSVLDQASLLERRFERDGRSLGQAVAHVLAKFDRYSLQHALLAALPVREVITTNYDQLFERAWQENHHDEPTILPYQFRRDSNRWLLKMHGCVTRPEQIVLSRSNYTRYDENLPALAGIVQAFLVTRHVLFTGFSLTDDNFHRIVDAVRRIRQKGTDPGPLGTALILQGAGVLESLWEREIHLVKMERETTSGAASLAESARRAEIFLDALALHARTSAHLLVGKRFQDVLAPSDRRIRDALGEFIARLRLDDAPDSLRDSVAWPEVRRMLVALGYPIDPPQDAE